MRPFRRAAAMAFLLAIAACAPQHAAPPTAGQDVGRAPALSYGTIVSIRPASVRADSAGVSDILVAIGARGDAVAGSAVEFIVHEDFAPAPISVVQTDAGSFRPGERVTITRGVRTRLARGAPPAPPGS
jgi:outer membrane lipoprotein SlyB